MFKKILIVEDIDSIQNSVISLLKELTDAEVQHSKYCDEAYLKIKKAKLDQAPFDLFNYGFVFCSRPPRYFIEIW